jgi:Transglycosylase SLT domain
MASIQYVVTATDAASAVFAKIGASADGLDKQLADLSKRIATPEVDLKDAAFTAGMISAAKRLDRLSEKMATPGADLKDTKFQAEIIKINAQLDRLDRRHVTATVDVNVNRSFLSRLTAGALGGFAGGGGKGGAGAAAGAASSAASAASSGSGLLSGGSGIAIGVGAAALTSLAALGAGLGGLIPELAAAATGFAALGAFAIPTLTALVAKSPAMSALKTVFGSMVAAMRPDVVHLFNLGVKILIGLLPQLLPFADAVAKGLGRMLDGIKRFTASNAFGTFMNQMSALVGPFMAAIGPAIGKIVIALGKLMTAFLNKNDIRAAVIVLEAAAVAIQVLAKVVGWFSTTVVPLFDTALHVLAIGFDAVRHGFANNAHQISDAWDVVRHATATAADFVRGKLDDLFRGIQVFAHDWARMFDEIRRNVATWGHSIAGIFDTLRHGIAAIWDLIWNNTVTRVRSGISDVVGFFKGLPGKALDALRGFGHSLYAFAHAALDDFLSGLKSVGGTVLGWLRNFIGGIPHAIMSFLHMSPPHAGSAFYDLGANIMRHLAAGIKATAHLAVNAASAAAHRVSAAGSGVQRWAGLVRQALAMEGLSPGLAGNVLYQMQTESGGNPNAINETDVNFAMGDPSRGLMQVIGSTFAAYHWPGTSGNIFDPLANIAAALNYARHVYGPSLMSGGMGIGSGHGYATGSWNVPYTGPAVVHQGEMIIPAAAAAAVRSGGGGNTYVTVNVKVGHGTSPRQAAKEIADILNQGATSGVKLRRSILSANG